MSTLAKAGTADLCEVYEVKHQHWRTSRSSWRQVRKLAFVAALEGRQTPAISERLRILTMSQRKIVAAIKPVADACASQRLYPH